jgi:hypothetical protein
MKSLGGLRVEGGSNFVVVYVLDAGVEDVVDVLHLLAQQLVIARVAEPSLDFRIDQLNLLDHCVLQLTELGRSSWVQPIIGIIAEDCLLFKLLHPRPNFFHHSLDRLDLLC